MTAPAIRSWLRPLLGWALLWWLLGGGAPGSWFFGAPAVVAAAGVSRALRAGPPRRRLRLLALFGFAGYFARESLRSGWDVARRALAPGARLRPGLIDHPLSLPPGAPRELFVLGVSLLPGTLSTTRSAAGLRVQVLDLEAPVRAELDELERRVAAVFGVEADVDRREPA